MDDDQAPLSSQVIPLEHQSDKRQESDSKESQHVPNERVEEVGEESDDDVEGVLPDMPSIAPDILYIAGHLFHILHGVSEDAREEFGRLGDMEDVTYEDIPQYLKAYEFAPKGYEGFAREEREMGPLTYVD